MSQGRMESEMAEDFFAVAKLRHMLKKLALRQAGERDLFLAAAAAQGGFAGGGAVGHLADPAPAQGSRKPAKETKGR